MSVVTFYLHSGSMRKSDDRTFRIGTEKLEPMTANVGEVCASYEQ